MKKYNDIDQYKNKITEISVTKNINVKFEWSTIKKRFRKISYEKYNIPFHKATYRINKWTPKKNKKTIINLDI